MITVKPYGGLGNRIRVLHSVFDINFDLNDQIRIIWDHEAGLNCAFEELFEVPENCTIRNIPQGMYRKIKKYAKRLGLVHFYHLKYDTTLIREEVKNYVNNREELLRICRNRSVYIHTCYSFSWKRNNFEFLKPTASIQDRAEKIYRKFDSYTYGIHIRRTDNLASIKHSPLQAYRALIKKIIDKNKSVRFFLSTDSKGVEKALIDEFQKYIITSGNKSLNRNSSEGIKSALVDILCLSQTCKIYGSYGSSFSTVPGLFTGVECKNVVSGE